MLEVIILLPSMILTSSLLKFIVWLSNHGGITIEAIKAQKSEVTFLRLHSKTRGKKFKPSDIVKF